MTAGTLFICKSRKGRVSCPLRLLPRIPDHSQEHPHRYIKGFSRAQLAAAEHTEAAATISWVYQLLPEVHSKLQLRGRPPSLRSLAPREPLCGPLKQTLRLVAQDLFYLGPHPPDAGPKVTIRGRG